MTVTLFTNVSAGRRVEMLAACSHLPYRVWAEPDGDNTFKIICDKSQRLEGREASGDAGGARSRPQARAALRGPGSNPWRSTTPSLAIIFKR